MKVLARNSRYYKKSEKNFGGSKKVSTFAVPFETSRVKMRFQRGFGSLTILREKIKEVKKDRKRVCKSIQVFSKAL